MSKECLAICNSCGIVMTDENPQIDAPTFETSQFSEVHAMVLVGSGEDQFWACPHCLDDGCLMDLQDSLLPEYVKAV